MTQNVNQSTITPASIRELRRGASEEIRAVAVCLLVVSTLLCAYCATRAPHSIEVFEATAIGWIIALFTSLRLMRYPLDMTEPVHALNASFLLMYSCRPLVRLYSGEVTEPYHERFVVAPGYAKALLIAGLAIIVFNLAYGTADLSVNTKLESAASLEGHRFTLPGEVRFVRSLSVVLLVVGGAGLIKYNFISTLARDGNVIGGGSTSAYSYMLPLLCIPAAMLLISVHPSAGSWVSKLGWFVILAIAANLMLSGSRFILIALVAALSIHVGIITGKRIPRKRLAIVGLLAFALLSFVRDINAPGQSISLIVQSIREDPGGLIAQSAVGDDTEMVDALALEVMAVPSQIHHQPGHALWAAVMAPLPRPLFPWKPVPPDVIMNTHFFGTSVNQPAIAYALIGEWYFDSGLLGIVLAFAILGKMTRAILLLKQSNNPCDAILYAVLAANCIILTRGSVTYIVANLLALGGPIFLARIGIERLRRQIYPLPLRVS